VPAPGPPPCGRPCSPPAPPRSASARATPSASRLGSRSTATTSTATTPLEAGLGWVVKLDKLSRGEPFVGAEALAAQKAAGLTRTLVGFKVQDRNIARHGAEVVDAGGAVIGQVTSGGPAPTVGGAVGLAYVPLALAAPGTLLTIAQRGRSFPAEVVKGPFYRRVEPAAS
jgi:aminomethyltransferase